jgi:hypothetical protein
MNHTNHVKLVVLGLLLIMAGCGIKIRESVFDSPAFVYENPSERCPPNLVYAGYEPHPDCMSAEEFEILFGEVIQINKQRRR